jgi:hypothetical protein
MLMHHCNNFSEWELFVSKSLNYHMCKHKHEALYVCWGEPVIPVLGRLRQYCEFKFSLGYAASPVSHAHAYKYIYTLEPLSANKLAGGRNIYIHTYIHTYIRVYIYKLLYALLPKLCHLIRFENHYFNLRINERVTI